MIKEEAQGRFESRAAVPGHFQQGGKPSPMDRVRALRMSIKCMQHIESYAGKDREAIAADPLSAAVIGVKGSQVLFSPMGGATGLEATETDWARRRPKTEFWLELQDVSTSCLAVLLPVLKARTGPCTKVEYFNKSPHPFPWLLALFNSSLSCLYINISFAVQILPQSSLSPPSPTRREEASSIFEYSFFEHPRSY